MIRNYTVTIYDEKRKIGYEIDYFFFDNGTKKVVVDRLDGIDNIKL